MPLHIRRESYLLNTNKSRAHLYVGAPDSLQTENPYLRKDIIKLENVQRRATKMVKDSKDVSYEQRVKNFGLNLLKWSRKRGNLITTFKLLKGFNSPKLTNNFNINLDLNGKNLRRHKYQMKRELVKNCPARYYFLMNRVAPAWNSLPESIVNAKTINEFKNKLDDWNFKRKLH